MHLTPSQLAAISYRGGHLQLLACAGSGKTEVVARRVADLLDPRRSGALTPANIVAFTFTDRAAAELKARIARRVRETRGDVHGLPEMFVGTIHAFCKRRSTTAAPATSPSPGPSTATASCYEARRSTTSPPSWSAASTSSAATSTPGSASPRASAASSSTSTRTPTSCRSQVVRALADFGATLTVVGDDDQTIFQWNGADVQNILGFADRYPGAHTIRLEENFRSSAAIVTFARDFIAHVPRRLEKAMKPTDAQPAAEGDVLALSFQSGDG